MKIAFFDVDNLDIDHYRKALSSHDLIFVSEPANGENIKAAKDADIVSVRIYSKLDKKLLGSLTSLKFIALRTTGYDNIDLGVCKERDITVSNVPNYGDSTVAEYTFTLMLALLRKLPQSIRSAREGNVNFAELLGYDLKGKTLGIIGTGRIGLNVARIAQGFLMNILGYDLLENKGILRYGLKYTGLSKLLSSSDIVTLHLPLTKETNHFLNDEKIGQMKDGTFIVNTGRGGLIDATALLNGLISGKIAGAGLDVLEVETHKGKTGDNKVLLEAQRKLEELDSVILSPHNAFNTREACERIRETTVGNIEAFEVGKTLNMIV